jgi:lipopolysaccharide heptosyltransferase II
LNVATNILILSMTRMGDMIQTTPLIKGLRQRYPTAKITLLVTSDFAGAVPLIPEIDESIVVNLRQFDNQENWEDLSWIKIYRYLEKSLEDIKNRNFDLLVNLSHSKFSALMVRYLGIKDVVGFYCNDFGNRMTGHPWMQYFSVEIFNRKYNEFNLAEIFSRSGGVDVKGRSIEVVRPENQESVDTLIPEEFQDGEILIGFQAGSSLEGRRWPVQSFASLADMLIKNLNARILIFGVESENEVAEDIVSMVQNKDKITNLAGKTNLNQLSGLLEKCSYLVTNDTGTMHLAAALGTKIVGLFFAHAHPYETAPFSPGHLIFQARISCAPCSYGVHCNNIVCVDKVHPQHLCSAIENHKKTESWILPEQISQNPELNVFETGFDFDNNFILRPHVKHSFDMDDIFRTAYRLLWREVLDAKPISDDFEFLLNGLCENLKRDYDCTEIERLEELLGPKYLVLEDMVKLAEKGRKMCGILIREVSGSRGNPNKISQSSADISCIDEKIEELGLTNPELRPLSDMFIKRKENLAGDNVSLLAIETRKDYADLINECGKMKKILTSCVANLSADRSSYISHNSINVAVPGR